MLFKIIAMLVAMLFAVWLATTAIGKFLYVLLFFAIIGLTLANMLGYGFGLEFGLGTFIELGVISALLAVGNTDDEEKEV